MPAGGTEAPSRSCLGPSDFDVVDTISTRRRSENMRRIRSKGTKPEILVRRVVHALGYRFRLHDPKLPGKPDLVFPRLKRLVEVRGCFWHQHDGCIDSHIPKSRREYWRPKLRRNVRRDRRNLKALRELGWRVLLLWECEVMTSDQRRLRTRLRKFLSARAT
jgi:DNA mismatch endonuclease, patch repair protein